MISRLLIRTASLINGLLVATAGMSLLLLLGCRGELCPPDSGLPDLGESREAVLHEFGAPTRSTRHDQGFRIDAYRGELTIVYDENDRVERLFIYPTTLPGIGPQDIPPPTPDYTGLQGYLGDPPIGIGATEAKLRWPGADGNGITIVDIEFEWVFDHEDLLLPGTADIIGLPSPNPTNDEGDHGTATLGVLGAEDNGYGVTGIVPRARLLVAPSETSEPRKPQGLRRAFCAAMNRLGPGDVIVTTIGICGCGKTTPPCNLVPPEVYWENYEIIREATSRDIIVVEAAGNSNFNLDDPACGAWQGRPDSGAIIVGAGDPNTHAHVTFPGGGSNYGSRVDVQGWGRNVFTTGIGDIFDPNDIRQRYGYYFQTSAAAAIVAGAVASIQGARRAAGHPILRPKRMRSLLKSTGTPQPAEPQHIGPLPNLLEAISAVLSCGSTPHPECGGDCPPQQRCSLAGHECFIGGHRTGTTCTVPTDCCDEDEKCECRSTVCACTDVPCGLITPGKCGGACRDGEACTFDSLTSQCSCERD